MKKNWTNHFHNKKITMLGLGLLGRGINVAKFLVENGAILTVTDLKSREVLSSSLKELGSYANKITFVLGEHRLEDFQNSQMIIKAAGVPLDSPYIAEARKHNIPVEMDASLFAKLAPKGVTLIGVTGTRGKSTTTSMIAFVLTSSGRKVHLGGNIRGLATLPLLNKVEDGDYVVLELDSWQLQGFGEAKISPHVAIFTNLMPDHMNYYKNDMDQYFADKANIFLYQKQGDVLITSRDMLNLIKKRFHPLGKIISRNAADLPSNFELKIPGVHNRANAVLAQEAAKFLKVKAMTIKKALEKFSGVEGRLQLVGEKNGVTVYNDNNATTADATVAGLEAVSKGRNIVLIVGGADKGLDMTNLLGAVKTKCRIVICLSGTGTEKIKPGLLAIKDLMVFEFDTLKECFSKAVKVAKSGEVILFSPAFASFSKYFQNEYERNDLFLDEVQKWLRT